ncbi:DUF2062 domain-containing protein [Bryobacter aggregatus]|uniref:DUF2062 domain-containing protein n=1 Tax=Bryobacter aggregatus TaxID=360054 RepID=UPI000689FC5D|nr:DUF2062 domain-containing protein [Bryobacter aggregatus]
MRKLRERLLDQLRQGTSPESLALTLVLGLSLGTVPLPGSSTLLCAGAAFWFRLNQPLLQLVNYLLYPLQLLLYLPLLVAGARLLDPSLASITTETVSALFRESLWGAVQRLFWAHLGALLIWAMAALPVGTLLYVVLLRLMRNFHKTGKASV